MHQLNWAPLLSGLGYLTATIILIGAARSILKSAKNAEGGDNNTTHTR
jgi:hypothetical protein